MQMNIGYFAQKTEDLSGREWDYGSDDIEDGPEGLLRGFPAPAWSG